MSAYHPPHHNRLLDLELDLRHKQPGATAPNKRPPVRSVQGRRTYRQLVSDPVTPRAEKQPARRQPQTLSLQQQSRLGEPQSRRTQAESGVNRAAATPRNPRPRNSDRSTGSYRRLASQMGKYYNPHKPFEQRPQNDLPEIQTPIGREVVADFTASMSMPPKRKRRPTPSPAGRPRSPSTNPPPQPKWQSLAISIRQARLGIGNAVPGAPADTSGGSREEKLDWAIDEAITKDPELSGLDRDQSTARVEDVDSPFESPSTGQSQHRTSAQNVPQGMISPEKDQQGGPPFFGRVPSVPVTIDVTSVAITSNRANRTTKTSTVSPEDGDTPTATQVEKPPLEPAAGVERIQTEGRLDREGTSAPKMGNPDDAQGVERPIPTADLDPDSMSVKGRVLKFYQLTCRSQIVKYFAQFQRKIHKLRENHGQG